MLLIWGFIFYIAAINCFWKIRVVLKRTFKGFAVVGLKRTNWRQVQWFTTADAVWSQLTAEEAEVGLVAADVLAMWRWW